MANIAPLPPLSALDRDVFEIILDYIKIVKSLYAPNDEQETPPKQYFEALNLEAAIKLIKDNYFNEAKTVLSKCMTTYARYLEATFHDNATDKAELFKEGNQTYYAPIKTASTQQPLQSDAPEVAKRTLLNNIYNAKFTYPITRNNVNNVLRAIVILKENATTSKIAEYTAIHPKTLCRYLAKLQFIAFIKRQTLAAPYELTESGKCYIEPIQTVEFSHSPRKLRGRSLHI